MWFIIPVILSRIVHGKTIYGDYLSINGMNIHRCQTKNMNSWSSSHMLVTLYDHDKEFWCHLVYSVTVWPMYPRNHKLKTQTRIFYWTTMKSGFAQIQTYNKHTHRHENEMKWNVSMQKEQSPWHQVPHVGHFESFQAQVVSLLQKGGPSLIQCTKILANICVLFWSPL